MTAVVFAELRGVGFYLAVLGAVLLMVVPVPPPVLDVLVLLNFSLAITVLLVAMQVERPLLFSSFPTVLLLATLFRLAVNIATTRSILARMNGGTVIHTFGDFVVGGEPVVGFIVFLILVLVQYLVITKGAERVAEVAARFTLDALPGKQMSIDADLSSGLIGEEEVRRRRRELQREADFYGAMDGASKFVRGEAIAALVILFINILGGFLIGMLVHGKSFQESLHIYTVLSVGEGLVQQIPALFVSAATGILLTRSSGDARLDAVLAREFSAFPRNFYLVALVLLALGVFTPIPLFLPAALALLFFAVARRMERQAQKDVAPQEAEERQERALWTPEGTLEVLTYDPVEFEFGYGLVPLVDPKHGGDFLERILLIRRQLALELGFVVPTVRVRDNLALPQNRYVVKIHGGRVGEGEVYPDRLLAVGVGEAEARELGGLASRDPTFGLPAAWIPPDVRPLAEDRGYTVVDASTVLATHFTEILRRHAHELLGREETRALLDHVKKTHPTLVQDLVPGTLTLTEVQKVLRNLLREGIPIRNLVTVLEVLAEYAPRTKNPDELTEHVRQALARVITERYAPDGELKVIHFAADAEERLLGALRARDGSPALLLAPEDVERLYRSLGDALRRSEALGVRPVLLTSPAVRRAVRELVERVFPDLPVLSYAELLPNVRVEGLSVITL